MVAPMHSQAHNADSRAAIVGQVGCNVLFRSDVRNKCLRIEAGAQRWPGGLRLCTACMSNGGLGKR